MGRQRRTVLQVVVNDVIYDAIAVLAQAEKQSVSAWCRKRLSEAVEEFFELPFQGGERHRLRLIVGGQGGVEDLKRSVPPPTSWRG